MGKQFHELRERLLSAGVAPRHARRYIAELRDHLADLTSEEERGGLDRREAESVALARLGDVDNLAKALIKRREFQSWSSRAPWAILGLSPLCCLAATYFVACFILWSGWKLFEPGLNSPFVKVYGVAVIYFGVGRLLYFSAPILVGWGIGALAVRQRMQWIGPTVGLLLIALAGGVAQVHAGHPTIPGGAGPISMTFSLGNTVESLYSSLSHALVLFFLTVVPWLIGRSRIFRAFVR